MKTNIYALILSSIAIISCSSNKDFSCNNIDKNNEFTKDDHIEWLSVSVNNITEISKSSNVLNCHAQITFTDETGNQSHPDPIDFDYKVYKTESGSAYSNIDTKKVGIDLIQSLMSYHSDKIIQEAYKTTSGKWLSLLKKNNKYYLKLGEKIIFQADLGLDLSKLYKINGKDTVVVQQDNSHVNIDDGYFSGIIQIDESGNYTKIASTISNLGTKNDDVYDGNGSQLSIKDLSNDEWVIFKDGKFVK